MQFVVTVDGPDRRIDQQREAIREVVERALREDDEVGEVGRVQVEWLPVQYNY